MSESLSQADLDALFGGLSDPETVPEAKEPTGEYSGIRMEANWELPLPVCPDGGDTLSQDDIDKLLAEFGT